MVASWRLAPIRVVIEAEDPENEPMLFALVEVEARDDAEREWFDSMWSDCHVDMIGDVEGLEHNWQHGGAFKERAAFKRLVVVGRHVRLSLLDVRRRGLRQRVRGRQGRGVGEVTRATEGADPKELPREVDANGGVAPVPLPGGVIRKVEPEDFQFREPWKPHVPVQWVVIACPHCGGSGTALGSGIKDEWCKGHGLVKRRYDMNALEELK